MLRWPRPERGSNAAEGTYRQFEAEPTCLAKTIRAVEYLQADSDRDRISTTEISKSVRSCLWPFARGRQSAVEEFSGGAVGEPNRPSGAGREFSLAARWTVKLLHR